MDKMGTNSFARRLHCNFLHSNRTDCSYDCKTESFGNRFGNYGSGSKFCFGIVPFNCRGYSIDTGRWSLERLPFANIVFLRDGMCMFRSQSLAKNSRLLNRQQTGRKRLQKRICEQSLKRVKLFQTKVFI